MDTHSIHNKSDINRDTLVPSETDMEKKIAYVQSNLTENDKLLQLAEECGELAQAACKLARINIGSNPTPKTYDSGRLDLIEELADVMLCYDSLFYGNNACNEAILDKKSEKLNRWYHRIHAARSNNESKCEEKQLVKNSFNTCDGKEIKTGCTYYGKSDAKRWTVVAINSKSSHPIDCVSADGADKSKQLKPKWLVSEKPAEAFDCNGAKIYPGQVAYLNKYPLTVIVNSIMHENTVEITTLPNKAKTGVIDSTHLSLSNPDSEILIESDMNNYCLNWKNYCDRYCLISDNKDSYSPTAIKHLSKRCKKLGIY